MTETGEGGRFTEVVLRPEVSVASSAMVDAAMALHAAAPSGLLHRQLGELPGAP
jgi:hypothetical protein